MYHNEYSKIQNFFVEKSKTILLEKYLKKHRKELLFFTLKNCKFLFIFLHFSTWFTHDGPKLYLNKINFNKKSFNAAENCYTWWSTNSIDTQLTCD